MNEQEYNEALDKTHIPHGPDWNRRYLTALEANGLKLVPAPEKVEGYYVLAPLPVVADESATWGESLIVPYYEQ